MKMFIVTGFDKAYDSSIYGIYYTMELAENRITELPELQLYIHDIKVGKSGVDLFISM